MALLEGGVPRRQILGVGLELVALQVVVARDERARGAKARQKVGRGREAVARAGALLVVAQVAELHDARAR